MAEMEKDKELRLAEAEQKRLSEEMNLKRLEMESQKEVRLKELELRMANDARQEDGDRQRYNGDREHLRQADSAKYVKMPIFREDKDCLDAYLLRFERTCTAYKVPNDLWSLTLVKSLQGKALEVYERMGIEESQDYEKLKEELLKRFRLSESGYRRKYKQSLREKDESPMQYVERLRRYLRQWHQMSGLSDDREGLEQLMLRDQFFIMCDNDMRRFLKEKGKLSLDDMLEQAQNFIEARESDERKWVHTQKSKEREFKTQVSNNKQKVYDKTNGCQEKFREQKEFRDKNQFKSNWKFSDLKKDRGEAANQKGGCFRCGSKSHYLNQCDKRDKPDRDYRVAAIQGGEELDRTNDKREAVISYCSAYLEQKGSYATEGHKYQGPAVINGHETQGIFDSGSNCVAVREDLIEHDKYTDQRIMCTFMNGVKQEYPMARVEIQSEFLTGVVEAAVIRDLEEGVIIGSRLETIRSPEVSMCYCETEVVKWKTVADRNTEVFTSNVKVNRWDTKCLYDTGTNCVAVQKKLVEPGQYTGESMVCRFANGKKEKYPMARIKIEGEDFKGVTDAVVIESLVIGLITGPCLYEKSMNKSRVTDKQKEERSEKSCEAELSRVKMKEEQKSDVAGLQYREDEMQ